MYEDTKLWIAKPYNKEDDYVDDETDDEEKTDDEDY